MAARVVEPAEDMHPCIVCGAPGVLPGRIVKPRSPILADAAPPRLMPIAMET
jgi:hypothetical protein